MLRIDKSIGKGVGVFALRHFKPGEVVAMYPLMPPDEEDRKKPIYLLNLYGRTVTGKPWKGPVPFIVPDTTLAVAHLVNDGGFIFSHGKWPGIDAFARDVSTYQRESKTKCNISVGGNDGSMVALRDIKPGDELLFHYGMSYWIYQAYGSNISWLAKTKYNHPYETSIRFVFHSALWMPYIEAGNPDMPQLEKDILDVVHMLDVPCPLVDLDKCLDKVRDETKNLDRYPMSEGERLEWFDKMFHQAGHGTVSNDPSRQI